MKKLLIAMITLISIVGCSKKQAVKLEESRFLFGTYIKIMVYTEDKKQAISAIEAAFNEIERIDLKFNTKSKGSLFYTLNNSENKRASIDQEGLYILEEVGRVSKLSDGGFDMTTTPLRDLWGFGVKDRKNLPTKDELKEVLKLVDYSKVVVEGNDVSLQNPIVEIDTGAFLKGYALKQAREVLLEKGIISAYISAVSSIETIGTKPDNKRWRIGLQDPSEPSDIFGIVNLDGRAMGVSGDYQTYMEIGGKRYHHILDTKTGYPVKDKKMVVVIGSDSFKCDMYSTAFFTMKVEDVLTYVKENKDLEVLIIDENSKVIKSDGFSAYLD